MWPDRVSNPGHPTYESGALPIALRGPFTYMAGIETIQKIDWSWLSGLWLSDSDKMG